MRLVRPMLPSNTYLLIFALAFMGCVLATPVVTRVAGWLGAIDRPDQFRRIHKGATPRLGGLALGFGLVLAIALMVAGNYLHEWADYHRWLASLFPIGLAAAIILAVGVVDDAREIGPRVKLLGQASAVVVLYLGGIRIDTITLMNRTLDLTAPGFDLAIAGHGVRLALPALMVSMLWFLACMNIWNLIDGMDGLASGVGLLVSGTLALVAIWLENPSVAILAAALAGGLAGFLLYNWHPACIFLGDSGSLMIGLLIGIIGVQGSLKEGATISILFPILAMGLPITDTAMAIFRRWVRNLPLSSADRRHIHHLLIGLGLNPRQAAAMLYCFSAGLCGVVMLGVVYKNEVLALAMGISGCLAFLLILTSRRDELTTLRSDLQARLARGKQERFAAKVTWEAIQRVELCTAPDAIWAILRAAAGKLGCDHIELSCRRDGLSLFEGRGPTDAESAADAPMLMSGPTVTFRLSTGRESLLIVSLHQHAESTLAADIAFRFVQRLSLASAERLERLFGADERPETILLPAGPDCMAADGSVPSMARLSPRIAPSDASPLARPIFGRIRNHLGWPWTPAASGRPLGEE
ncbi:MraY family glycosyltransferase [Tundrisphaera sp. TA3]|uniref:MraY family glycosyltransferase n=1 Tax=Tundrisphaera sp. TA3 TaxID=3435775 RepID=UPI003EB92771